MRVLPLLLLAACHREPRADLPLSSKAGTPGPGCGATGAWRDGPLFAVARGGHTATLLPDGMVLLWGGHKNLHVPEEYGAETFDPAGKRDGTGFGVPLRTGHRAAILPDGRVLIVGGDEAMRAAGAVIFDPVAAQVSASGGPIDAPAEPAAPPVGAPPGAAIAWLADGRALAAGGRDDDGVPLKDAAIWTGAAWCPVAPMRDPRSDAAAVVLPDGAVMVTGGRTGGPTEMDPFIRTTEVFALAP